MKVLHLSAAALLAWGGFAAFNVASATTYYVRTDGGTATQCNGRADAAYPGSGSNVSCAWNHPFVALPPSNSSSAVPARIHGGDTLVIDAGSYQMGADWKDNSKLYSACSLSAPWGCEMQAIPSGTSTNPTRIVGAGWDSGCKAPPELWGSDRPFHVVDLDGSSNVVVACLNITDHSACIEGDTNAAVKCARSEPPYGQWASVGLHAQDSHNVTLQDLRIHGMAHTGIQAGRLSNWTLNRVKIIANGLAGWDGDLGGSQSSSNSGNMVFNNVEIGWTGCAEKYPYNTIYACWGQREGGYGDSLGTAKTGGNWTFNQVYIHNGTQDGLDMLYADGTGKVTVLRSRFEGNAGNQVKISGPSVIQNSVIIGSCASFNGKYDMSSGDNCRGAGNALVLKLFPGALSSVSYNTITGQGDCLIQPTLGDSSSEVDVYNNVLVGQTSWLDSSKKSCLFWWGNPPTGQVAMKGNVIWNTRYYTSYPSGNTVADPLLKSELMASFDPTLLVGSPAIDKANTVITLKTDYAGHARPVGAGYDAGSYEFGSTSTGGTSGGDGGSTTSPSRRHWKTGGALPARQIGSSSLNLTSSAPARSVTTQQDSVRKVSASTPQHYSLRAAIQSWLGDEEAALR
jgi:hypothetical protein